LIHENSQLERDKKLIDALNNSLREVVDKLFYDNITPQLKNCV